MVGTCGGRDRSVKNDIVMIVGNVAAMARMPAAVVGVMSGPPRSAISADRDDTLHALTR